MNSLFQIGPDHINEFVGPMLALRGISSAQNMIANVILHHFAHEPIDGAADGGNELENVSTTNLFIEGALYRLYLTADAANAL